VCAQFKGSGLISGFYGDACEFVMYNRSGIRSFSTSVLPLSKFAFHSHIVTVTVTGASIHMSNVAQVSARLAFHRDCRNNSCYSVNDSEHLHLCSKVKVNGNATQQDNICGLLWKT
jgi:hypothetical protein